MAAIRDAASFDVPLPKRISVAVMKEKTGSMGSDLQITDAGVDESPLARVASDHLPIWADIRLTAA